MKDFISRSYTKDDFLSCMAIFDSNVPNYFATSERKECYVFLKSINCNNRPYLIFTHKDNPIACGGLIIKPNTQEARLAWGMVDNAFHNKGIGTNLTQARIDLARQMPNISKIGLETSQHTYKFYEKFGFKVQNKTPNGFAPNLDCYEMRLDLN